MKLETFTGPYRHNLCTINNVTFKSQCVKCFLAHVDIRQSPFLKKNGISVFQPVIFLEGSLYVLSYIVTSILYAAGTLRLKILPVCYNQGSHLRFAMWFSERGVCQWQAVP